MSGKLIQFTVSPFIHDWLKNRAKQRNQTLASYARDQVLKEFEMSVVPAWCCPKFRSDPKVVLHQGFRPTYYLMGLGETARGHRRFGLLHTRPEVEGKRVTNTYWQDTETFAHPERYRFVLEGSPYRWCLMNSFHDRKRRLMVVELDIEGDEPTTHEQWSHFLEQRTLGLLMQVHRGPDPTPAETATDLEQLLILFRAAFQGMELPSHLDPDAAAQPTPGTPLRRSNAEQILARVLEATRHLRSLDE